MCLADFETFLGRSSISQVVLFLCNMRQPPPFGAKGPFIDNVAHVPVSLTSRPWIDRNPKGYLSSSSALSSLPTRSHPTSSQPLSSPMLSQLRLFQLLVVIFQWQWEWRWGCSVRQIDEERQRFLFWMVHQPIPSLSVSLWQARGRPLGQDVHACDLWSPQWLLSVQCIDRGWRAQRGRLQLISTVKLWPRSLPVLPCRAIILLSQTSESATSMILYTMKDSLVKLAVEKICCTNISRQQVAIQLWWAARLIFGAILASIFADHLFYFRKVLEFSFNKSINSCLSWTSIAWRCWWVHYELFIIIETSKLRYSVSLYGAAMVTFQEPPQARCMLIDCQTLYHRSDLVRYWSCEMRIAVSDLLTNLPNQQMERIPIPTSRQADAAVGGRLKAPLVTAIHVGSIISGF